MTRRTAALAAAVLLAVAGGSGASASMPDAGAGFGAEVTFAGESTGVAMNLTAYGPAVLTPSDALSATIVVANTTAMTKSGLRVTMDVTTGPLTTSARLAGFIDNPSAFATREAATRPVVSTSVASGFDEGVLPPAATIPLTIAATPTALGLPVNTAGVYGIVISVEGPSGVLATRSAAVTWYNASIAPLRVAFLATASGSPERVTRVAAAANVNGAALVLDPVQIMEDDQATTLAQGGEVFSLPSGDPDLTSLAHAGNSALLGFALEDAASNPHDALRDLPWIATLPVVDEPTAALAVANGATAGIVDVVSGARINADGPVVAVTSGGATLPVLVPNLNLSGLVATYRPGAPDAAARVVAESALMAGTSDGITPVVVAPGASWALPGPGASTVVEGLLGAPWVVPVSIRSVINSATTVMAAPASRGMDDDLAPDKITALDRQFVELGELASTAENPNDILLPGGRTLLNPLAVNLRGEAGIRASAFAVATEAVRTTLTSLQVASGSDVNLVAASGNVPVTLHNDLAVDATVTVVMKSTSPNLVVQSAPVVTIPAGGAITAHVPVTAVKSADVTATVALENADGDVVAAPQLLKVRVRADWGNAVTAVFTVGLVLLIVAGLIRTVRRGRRSTRMAPTNPETGGEDG